MCSGSLPFNVLGPQFPSLQCAEATFSASSCTWPRTHVDPTRRFYAAAFCISALVMMII